MNNFLDYFTSPQALIGAKVSFRMPFSSFEGLIRFVRKDISHEAYQDLFYFYSTIEKCILNYKNRDLHSGDALFRKIEKFDRNAVPPQTRNGVESAFLACEAYTFYTKGQYEEAYDRLLQLVPFIQAQGKIMPAFTGNLYEQNLNMLRVEFRRKNNGEIVKKMVQLLDSLLFDDNTPDTFDAGLAGIDDTDKNVWYFYFMDNLVLGLNGAYENEPEAKRAVYSAIVEQVLEHDRQHPTRFRQYISGLEIMQTILQKDFDKFNRLICERFNDLHTCPSLLRTLILSEYIGITQRAGADLTVHPNYANFEAVVNAYNLGHKLSADKIAA